MRPSMRRPIRWRVAEAPTGRYASFHRRAWPSAEYPSGQPAAQISCEDDYSPADARSGRHGELTVLVADWSVGRTEEGRRRHGAFVWRRAKSRARTLAEAKEVAERVIAGNPTIRPDVDQR